MIKREEVEYSFLDILRNLIGVYVYVWYVDVKVSALSDRMNGERKLIELNES